MCYFKSREILRIPIVLTLIVAMICSNNFLVFAREKSTIIATKTTVEAMNAPYNSSLITALYEKGNMIEAKIYPNNGKDSIVANFAMDMKESLVKADILKAFLFNVQTLSPICESFSLNVDDFPNENNNQMKITAGGKEFTAMLYESESTEELKKLLPMTLNMSELNGNEKYYYLSSSLPTNPQSTGTIHAGDIMIYGSDGIVIFYETFETSYYYTPIGHIDDIIGLKDALGTGSVTVKFY